VIRYKRLLTLKVINRETGEPMGKIVDVVYSDDYKSIAYLIIKNNNLIKNKVPVSYRDINFLNNNQALYLNTNDVIQDKLENNIKEGFKYIDKEIRTEEGECIGYIKDIIINKEEGTVEGFIITEGVFEDLLKGRNYMPLFDDTSIREDCICINVTNFN
jgi:uncharacterized protein YrrD